MTSAPTSDPQQKILTSMASSVKPKVAAVAPTGKAARRLELQQQRQQKTGQNGGRTVKKGATGKNSDTDDDVSQWNDNEEMMDLSSSSASVAQQALMAQLAAMQKALAEKEAKLKLQEDQMRQDEEARVKELQRLEAERLRQLEAREQELQARERERAEQVEKQRLELRRRELELAEREERMSDSANRSTTDSTASVDGLEENHTPGAARRERRRSSVPATANSCPCDCYQKGFKHCVENEKDLCDCSYSCTFVKEYFGDTKCLSDEMIGILNSSWADRRKRDQLEKIQRKEQERQEHMVILQRIQQELRGDTSGSVDKD